MIDDPLCQLMHRRCATPDHRPWSAPASADGTSPHRATESSRPGSAWPARLRDHQTLSGQTVRVLRRADSADRSARRHPQKTRSPHRPALLDRCVVKPDLLAPQPRPGTAQQLRNPRARDRLRCEFAGLQAARSQWEKFRSSDRCRVVPGIKRRCRAPMSRTSVASTDPLRPSARLLVPPPISRFKISRSGWV